MDALVLVGIAAGPRGKVTLGDVVYADQVYDYEEHGLEVVRWWDSILGSEGKGRDRSTFRSEKW